MRQKAAELAKSFERGRAVANPDHPYLLVGPDLLAADGDGLIALFFVHAAEERQPRLLEGRVILSKLALAGHTRFVLAGRDETIGNHAFDRVIDDQDPSSVRRSLRNVSRNRDVTPASVRDQARERLVRAGSVELVDDAAHDDRLPDRFPAGARSVRWVDGRMQSDARLLGRAALANRARSVLAISATSEFALDNGAVYPQVAHLPVNVLLADRELPRVRRGDPFKLQRALAFGGWTMPGVANELDYWHLELGLRWSEEL